MRILVHTDRLSQRAYGIWWIDPEGTLRDLYFDSTGPQATRGRVIMYGKVPGVSWDDYFVNLTERTPMFEDWALYDSMGMTPAQFLAALPGAPTPTG